MGLTVKTTDGKTIVQVVGTIQIAAAPLTKNTDGDVTITVSPITKKGDLVVGQGDGTPGRHAVGTDTYVLVADSTQPDGVKWAATLAATNPMTTLGDMIVGGASGVPTRLAIGADRQVLTADSGQTDGLAWETPGVICAKVALTAGTDTPGGVFAWPNPEAGAIAVLRTLLNLTHVATSACALDVGTAADGVTLDDRLLDGIDAHAALKLFDNMRAADAGTNGQPSVLVASGAYLTGSTASGASAGLVGFVYIFYRPL